MVLSNIKIYLTDFSIYKVWGSLSQETCGKKLRLGGKAAVERAASTISNRLIETPFATDRFFALTALRKRATKLTVRRFIRSV
jgi:hypothetical protein